MADIDVTERLGAERPLELRDSPEFFQLRSAVLRLLREAAGDEE
jgi:NitT/TauT family transport system ATP-binding protein